ncbi:MAG: hypothetical protein KDM91_20345 [Verrucomicrobiae bacterium]|nr:hypothetical protein [Verrucomicrobiae bacterium]MCP5540824.1 hypothetical protein [Akkermansiaceae bacterium]
MTWKLLWKMTLVTFVSLFLLMALATTILGALDIRRLFRHLRGDGDSPDDSTGSGH